MPQPTELLTSNSTVMQHLSISHQTEIALYEPRLISQQLRWSSDLGTVPEISVSCKLLKVCHRDKDVHKIIVNSKRSAING